MPLACLLLGASLSTTRAADAGADAAANLHRWGAVTLFHGLPSNHVRAIAQDTDGVMWFGTDGGLAKYDGRRIHRISASAMATAGVTALRVDADGVLWMGSQTGAARLIDGEIRPINETEGKAITSIITPERGRAILASHQGIVFNCHLKPDGTMVVKTINPEDHALLNIVANGARPLPLTSLALIDDRILVGTHSRGLLQIENGVVKEVLSRPRAFFIEAIELDNHGRPWFGAQTTEEDSGLYSSAELFRPEKIGAGTGTVTALKFAPDGDLWVGTEGQGAFLYRGSRRIERFTFENTAGGLRSNRVYSIHIDREGVVWFGTDRGVCRYDPQSPFVESVSPHPESNFARSLFQSSDGRLWCGTNRGLFLRDKSAPVWVEIPEFKGRAVHSIAEDTEGGLLVGTAGGLYRGESGATKKKPARMISGAATGYRRFIRIADSADVPAPVESVRAICRFRDAVYIASFGRGLERLEGTRRVLVWPTGSSNPLERQLVSLHAEGNERMWIGTADAGAFVFDGKQVRTEPSLENLSSQTVRAIESNAGGELWLATGGGLHVLKQDKLLAVLDDSDVRSVVISRGSRSQPVAWCATGNGGLYRVLLDEQAGPVIARLDSEQGMPSHNVFSILSVRSGRGEELLWIGTNRGVVRYSPGTVVPTLSPTRVLGRRIFQAEEVRAGFTLEYPQNSLVLDVEAFSSRTFPEQFQYAFSLFDNAGKQVRHKLSREAQFLMEGLQPGWYRVTVRAFTNDLTPSLPLEISFQVAGAPFPWTTTALSILLMLALFALWWGSRQNVRLTQSNAALKEANRQLGDTRLQLAIETETERRRISRDLHDQTLADLRRLLLLTDQLPIGPGDNGHKPIEPTVFRGEIEAISTEIRRICEDLSPSVLANVGLVAALEWALANAVAQRPGGKNFEYEFVNGDNVEDQLRLTPAAQIQVY
ncbi:MAG TPA: two-component regulator propeller domain-containing protein, partial [Blastocatellia bacterium]|nr:two-component regulator propeller domain-containing protein [Blastocatellia bacterium]